MYVCDTSNQIKSMVQNHFSVIFIMIRFHFGPRIQDGPYTPMFSFSIHLYEYM